MNARPLSGVIPRVVSFYHRCAVGFFEPSSLALSSELRVARRLDREQVERLARAHLTPDATETRPALWWVDEAYLVVEYVVLVERQDRIRFIRALIDELGCDAVDVLDNRAVGSRRSAIRAALT